MYNQTKEFPTNTFQLQLLLYYLTDFLAFAI